MSAAIYVINAALKTIESVPLSQGLAQVKQIIGFDTIEADSLDQDGNTLYFDENCFLKESKHLGKFQIDTLAPVAGIGVIVRCQSTDPLVLETPSMSLEDLKSRIQFM